MIVADENIEQYWIELLRKNGYEVLSIREKHAGMADKAIVELVREKAGMLITEDKDFGELVFAHGFKEVTVIFLRYDQPQYKQIQQSVLDVVNAYYKRDGFFFITITPAIIRVRTI